MSIFIPKRLGGPHMPPKEPTTRPEELPPLDDEAMDFGLQGDGYDDNVDDGPPHEPDIEDLQEPAVRASAPAPLKKQLKRALARPTAIDDPSSVSTGTPARAERKGSTAKKVQLSCQLSFDHHRRLKIHSIMIGKTVLSIVEGWIEQHCPPL